jgi:hypothetical protein
LIVILSQPPPLISKVALDKFVKTVFGDDLISSKRLRWMIGTDGWVEDLVLSVKTSKDDPLKDERFLDRIGVMDRALFGTTFGGGFSRSFQDEPRWRQICLPEALAKRRHIEARRQSALP